MTQILNVPMPADEAIKIIKSIFESNKMVEIRITRRDYSAMGFIESETAGIVTGFDEHRVYFTDGNFEGSMYDNNLLNQKITINSITPIIPIYSVGEEVMILATGEIGEVYEIEKSIVYTKTDTNSHGHHRSEICKIA